MIKKFYFNKLLYNKALDGKLSAIIMPFYAKSKGDIAQEDESGWRRWLQCADNVRIIDGEIFFVDRYGRSMHRQALPLKNGEWYAIARPYKDIEKYKDDDSKKQEYGWRDSRAVPLKELLDQQGFMVKNISYKRLNLWEISPAKACLEYNDYIHAGAEFELDDVNSASWFPKYDNLEAGINWLIEQYGRVSVLGEAGAESEETQSGNDVEETCEAGARGAESGADAERADGTSVGRADETSVGRADGWLVFDIEMCNLCTARKQAKNMGFRGSAELNKIIAEARRDAKLRANAKSAEKAERSTDAERSADSNRMAEDLADAQKATDDVRRLINKTIQTLLP